MASFFVTVARFELVGQRLALGRGHQPHVAHVVHVRGDGGDGAAFAAGRCGVPGGISQILKQVLVDALVDRIGFQERLLEIEHSITLQWKRSSETPCRSRLSTGLAA